MLLYTKGILLYSFSAIIAVEFSLGPSSLKFLTISAVPGMVALQTFILLLY